MTSKKLFKIVKFVMILTIAILIPNAANAETTGIFYEDFESYSADTYPTSFTLKYNGTGTDNQKVISTLGYDETTTNVFRLEGASNWASEHFRALPESLPDILVVDAYVKPVSGSWPGRIGLWEETGTWGTRISAVLFEGGSIKVLQNGSDSDKVNIGTYTEGTWYQVTMVHDISAKTYDVYINGSLAVSCVPMH